MKANHVTFLLIALLLASCGKDSKQNDSNYWCCEDDNACWTCEQLTDTVGLNLYPFVPLPDGWQTNPSFDAVASRQIPEDFMRGMTTKELFYQYANCSLAYGLFLAGSSSFQGNFEGLVYGFNMLPELLKRPDSGQIFLEFLKYTNAYNIDYEDNRDCRRLYNFHLLQIAGQPEVINFMMDEEIDQYIFLQRRNLRAIQSLIETNPYYWGGISLDMILFGLGNVMIRYEFEQFTQQIESVKDSYRWYIPQASRIETVAIVDDCIEKFIKTRKK